MLNVEHALECPPSDIQQSSAIVPEPARRLSLVFDRLNPSRFSCPITNFVDQKTRGVTKQEV